MRDWSSRARPHGSLTQVRQLDAEGFGNHLPMRVQKETGLLQGVRQVYSPHQDSRPTDCDISLVVIHGISLPAGNFGGPWIDQLFTGNLDPAAHPGFEDIAHLRVAAHVVIARPGTLTQYVPFQARAWHAGISHYEGRENCNDFSIGVELEGCLTIPYEKVQYVALAKLISALCRVYPLLSTERIVGHSEIAPIRRLDPGPFFDWGLLRTLLARFCTAKPRS